MSFHEALTKLVNGECVGIQPEGVHGYLELFNPFWMTKVNAPKEMLRWAGTSNLAHIRTNEYLGKWFIVTEDVTT
jgi:hypothetical protein